ncbi:MAG: sulfurtransferase complex subunit TusD [Proteobacteria bacterium]|nr:sulfurtransferase complex subunit TusD [Pseudomonadota bacterium]
MKYALAVHGAPYSSNAAEHALSFIEALQACGHDIERVFFFHEGVYQGLNGQVTPQSLHDNALQARWAAVAAQGIELAVCIASGIKRGVVDSAEQERYDLPAATLHTDFTLVGLGQLIAAIDNADRYVEFPA